jgi:hypothetical protein
MQHWSICVSRPSRDLAEKMMREAQAVAAGLGIEFRVPICVRATPRMMRAA